MLKFCILSERSEKIFPIQTKTTIAIGKYLNKLQIKTLPEGENYS